MLPKKKGILIQFWLQDGSGKPFLSTRRPWIRPRPPTRARGRGSNCGTGRSCCPIQPGSAAICFLFSFFSARETENRCMYGGKMLLARKDHGLARTQEPCHFTVLDSVYPCVGLGMSRVGACTLNENWNEQRACSGPEVSIKDRVWIQELELFSLELFNPNKQLFNKIAFDLICLDQRAIWNYLYLTNHLGPTNPSGCRILPALLHCSLPRDTWHCIPVLLHCSVWHLTT